MNTHCLTQDNRHIEKFKHILYVILRTRLRTNNTNSKMNFRLLQEYTFITNNNISENKIPKTE